MTSTGPSTRLTYRQFGDAGLLVDVEDPDPERRWAAAQALGNHLRQHPPVGFVDVVASFTSVFVTFDPLRTDHSTIEVAVRQSSGARVQQPVPRQFTLPVVYGGSHGPDLEDAADLVGMSTDELIALHTSEPWVVRFVGSPAGAPLMDGPRLPASVPRLDVPRARVAPGSIGMSSLQSIIYNAPSPGGWRLIGRTPLRLFELASPPHVAYTAGDLTHVPADSGG